MLVQDPSDGELRGKVKRPPQSLCQLRVVADDFDILDAVSRIVNRHVRLRHVLSGAVHVKGRAQHVMFDAELVNIWAAARHVNHRIGS